MTEKSLPEVSASVLAKAKKYLADGRLSVAEVNPEAYVTGGSAETEYRAVVRVQGSDPTTPYEVHVWGSIAKCGCPARVWACAHLVAALLVLDVPHPAETASVTSLAGGALEDLIGDLPPPEVEGEPAPEVEGPPNPEPEVDSSEIDRLLGL